MKTQMHKSGLSGLITIMLVFFHLAAAAAGTSYSGIFDKSKDAQKDTSVYVIEGEIKDAETNEPLSFASVQLKNTNIATVANMDGEFVLKVPKTLNDGYVEITFIGYDNKSIPLAELLSNRKNKIEMRGVRIPLSEIKIRPDDAYTLMIGSMRRIEENYSQDPNMMMAFYRESIKKNWSYVSVSEAILELYKAPYTKTFRSDRLKLYKGRKSKDVKKMDTLDFKLQGGPATTVLLDIVKNPYPLFIDHSLQFFKFSIDGFTKVNDRLSYIIKFEQLPVDDYYRYNGRVYLDVENLAISAIEFTLDFDDPKSSSHLFVRKKPLSVDVEPLSAKYYVNYTEKNGKWYFNYARGDVKFKCDWDKKLFNTTYTTTSEIAVTDRSTDNIDHFKNREVIKFGDVFIDQVSYFYNEDFWGKHNYIKPDESIESAIRRLNRKVKRNQDL